MAREFLSRHGIALDLVDTGATPVTAEATLALVRERRICHVRWEGSMRTWDQRASPVPAEWLRRYFVHEDGGIRVPVLVAGDAVVRGFDEETYRRILGM
jgi:arsenate reductase-like glutaredoxin family protein